MNRLIILRYGELYLKGKNRGFFEKTLIDNIRKKLEKFDCRISFGRGRYEISDYPESEESLIIDEVKTVFGLKSLSVAVKIPSDLSVMSDIILDMIPDNSSFKIETHRADKKFPLTSPQISCKLGERLLIKNSSLKVDIHKPDVTVGVDIREDGNTYIFGKKIDCAGGMPVGSAGKGLLLLSGGIDSPVSGYMMAKRGLALDAVHFHSYPYTSEQAKEKVVSLAKIMSRYCGNMNLIVVPFTKIQEAIHNNCASDYMITIVRRFMMRISAQIAAMRKCGCLVNGESLGQVASQTMQSITVTNATVGALPVFRPLIGMDKQEIIDISLKIDTYGTSILPYEDCCTVFMPDSPVTKPTVERAEAEEAKLGNYSELIKEALDDLEIIKI